MSSITPVSYQATYIPVTPVRPVVYGRSGGAAAPNEDANPSPTPAGKPAGQGQIVDIKV